MLSLESEFACEGIRSASITNACIPDFDSSDYLKCDLILQRVLNAVSIAGMVRHNCDWGFQARRIIHTAPGQFNRFILCLSAAIIKFAALPLYVEWRFIKMIRRRLCLAGRRRNRKIEGEVEGENLSDGARSLYNAL